MERSLAAVFKEQTEKSAAESAKVQSLEQKGKESETEVGRLRAHYENLIHEIRAEAVVEVTEAERKESVRREGMVKQLVRALFLRSLVHRVS